MFVFCMHGLAPASAVLLPPLACRSRASLGLGVLRVEALAEAAATRGVGALALADVESLAAQPRFHAACRAQGVRAIKSRGGTTFCQDPQSAKHPSMPHTAVGTGAVDFVLPPARIAQELLKLHFHPYLSAAAKDEHHDGSREDHHFSRILNLLRTR